VHDVAREEHVTAAFIYTLLRLPWLAPDITTAIVNGRQPQQLNAKTLTRKASRLPTAWAEQRRLFGFCKILGVAETIYAHSSARSLFARVIDDPNKKSKPRNGAREIFVA
jgi:hypothetical protein